MKEEGSGLVDLKLALMKKGWIMWMFKDIFALCLVGLVMFKWMDWGLCFFFFPLSLTYTFDIWQCMRKSLSWIRLDLWLLFNVKWTPLLDLHITDIMYEASQAKSGFQAPVIAINQLLYTHTLWSLWVWHGLPVVWGIVPWRDCVLHYWITLLLSSKTQH